MLPQTADKIVRDEVMLDGNARFSLATFVTTWMGGEAHELYAATFDDGRPVARTLRRRAGRYVDHGELPGLHARGPLQMTVATTVGDRRWAFRYSTEGRSRTRYQSTDIATLRHQYPDTPTLRQLSDGRRPVVEPLGRRLRAARRKIPESAYVVIHGSTEQIATSSLVALQGTA